MQVGTKKVKKKKFWVITGQNCHLVMRQTIVGGDCKQVLHCHRGSTNLILIVHHFLIYKSFAFGENTVKLTLNVLEHQSITSDRLNIGL